MGSEPHKLLTFRSFRVKQTFSAFSLQRSLIFPIHKLKSVSTSFQFKALYQRFYECNYSKKQLKLKDVKYQCYRMNAEFPFSKRRLHAEEEEEEEAEREKAEK